MKCPVCGGEVTSVPHFDVREPQIRKTVLLHNESSNCPTANALPSVINQAFNADCLTGMSWIPDKSVDLILCDLPYGTTRNRWDVVIPFTALWEQYERIVKDNGAIVLFSDGLFTVQLIHSNMKLWRYNLVWDKVLSSGFLNANRQPLRQHEMISVFYKKPPTYNPQKVHGQKNHSKGKPKNYENHNYGDFQFVDNQEALGDLKHPTSILTFSKPHPSISVHPTQKPEALLEYLIKTYKNEGETVLDNCFGSGSTLVAATKCGRNCIGFEKEERYFNVSAERIQKESEAYARQRLDG